MERMRVGWIRPPGTPISTHAAGVAECTGAGPGAMSLAAGRAAFLCLGSASSLKVLQREADDLSHGGRRLRGKNSNSKGKRAGSAMGQMSRHPNGGGAVFRLVGSRWFPYL